MNHSTHFIEMHWKYSLAAPLKLIKFCAKFSCVFLFVQRNLNRKLSQLRLWSVISLKNLTNLVIYIKENIQTFDAPTRYHSSLYYKMWHLDKRTPADRKKLIWVHCVQNKLTSEVSTLLIFVIYLIQRTVCSAYTYADLLPLGN